MQTSLDFVSEKFVRAIGSAFPDVAGVQQLVEVTRSTKAEFGHYQCNSAMRLTKAVGQKPRDIAKTIVDNVDRGDIAQLEIAGPGFINIHLDPAYISRAVQMMADDDRLAVPLAQPAKRIIVDFSSPNTAKEMHVGHLRSTIIGDCLSRLFEFLGHDVLRLNHIGDWGTQFGMLITYMKDKAPEVLTGVESTDLTHLVKWYKASKKCFDEDPLFKKRSQEEVVLLQGGEPVARRAWEVLCAISRVAYQEIYDILDVELEERGESYYNPFLEDTVADLAQRGLVVESGGAKCIFLDGFKNREGDPLPLIIQKSDGGYNYDTTDMAAIRHRINEEKADRIIYVTDAGQAQHFKMLFSAAEKAGYLDLDRVQVDHVPFGMVLGADGKKFRTRSGETERLLDLLTAAVDHASKILEGRDVDLSDSERKDLARALGISAVKYADLSGSRTADYVFSYERMLRFEGNTAAFLLYAYVRVAGIRRKVGRSAKAGTKIVLEHPSEISLGMHLSRFGEVLERTTHDLLPNRLTEFLYELADKFNAFFRDCRVEGSEQQEERLLLSETVARTLQRGLRIVGVQTVERM
jgi:arginyl-tRNA synthetase